MLKNMDHVRIDSCLTLRHGNKKISKMKNGEKEERRKPH